MRATWKYLRTPNKPKRPDEQIWRDHDWDKIRVINRSGHTPPPGADCTVEYMTRSVDGGPIQVIINAVWED